MPDSLLYINSAGALVPVPQSGAADAESIGWVPASQQQAKEYALQQKYGSGLQQMATAAESFASALTGGLSTLAERGLGIPASDIAGRESANPAVSLAGGVAGVALPAVASLGGTLEYSAPSLIAKAGARAAEAVAPKAVVGLLEGGAGVAASAIRGAAGAGVEGALFGAGNVVHEAALGDPNLTAQSVMAQIGGVGALTGLVGGGAGAIGKLGGMAVSRFTSGDLGSRVTDMLEQAEGNSNLNATNARPNEIRKVMMSKGEEGATQIGREARDLGIIRNPFVDSPDGILERATAVKTEQGQAIDRIVSDAVPGGPVTTWDSIAKDVKDPIVKSLRSQGSTVGIADQFEGFLDKYGQAYAGKDLDLADVWKLKQDVGDFIYRNGKVLDPWAKELNTPVKRIYDHLDGMLEQGIKDSRGSSAVREWTTANRGYEVASTMARLAEKGIQRSAENNAVSLTGTLGTMTGIASGGPMAGVALGAASEAVRRRGASAMGYLARALRDGLSADAITALVDKSADMVASSLAAGVARQAATASVREGSDRVAALSALKASNDAVNDRINNGISSLVRAGAKAKSVGRSEVAAGISSVMGRSRDDQMSLFNRRAAAIGSMVADADHFTQALSDHSDGLHQHAPQTAQALQMASSRAVQFLASKIPRRMFGGGPLASEYTPSAADVARFHRYYDAVDKPLSVIKQLAAGTDTPESREALHVVYPQLETQAQLALHEYLMAPGLPRPPYGARLGMSRLMGQSMDGSNTGPAILHNQMALAPKPQQGPKGATPARADHVQFANRLQTPGMASASRK